MDPVKIGTYLAWIRRERGLTQEALGAKLEATNKTISLPGGRELSFRCRNASASQQSVRRRCRRAAQRRKKDSTDVSKFHDSQGNPNGCQLNSSFSVSLLKWRRGRRLKAALWELPAALVLLLDVLRGQPLYICIGFVIDTDSLCHGSQRYGVLY